jgi:hypothetical protein
MSKNKKNNEWFLNKILKLGLIKRRLYKRKKNINYQPNLFTNINLILKKTVFNIKNTTNLIYRYHTSRRRILVIGEHLLTKKYIFYMYKKNNHFYLPKSFWTNGLFTNKNHIGNLIKKDKSITTLIKKPSLIILDKHFDVIESELYKMRLPTILLNITNNIKSSTLEYSKKNNYILQLLINHSRGNLRKIFFSFIEKIFKHPKRDSNFTLDPYIKKIEIKSKILKYRLKIAYLTMALFKNELRQFNNRTILRAKLKVKKRKQFFVNKKNKKFFRNKKNKEFAKSKNNNKPIFKKQKKITTYTPFNSKF